jgi:hypothetical protein
MALRKPKSALRRFFYLGLFLTAAPCAAYLWARYDGSLPSQENWLRSGQNHGPWHYSAAHFYFYVPFLAPMLTSGFALDCMMRRKLGITFKAIALALAQALIAFLPLLACYWVID